ncbi:MAG TPA: hypothetical protein VNN72_29565 [Polyangiaceae bacterium]|nr:hypothetical protein [Polyangiaceae bacterium]
MPDQLFDLLALILGILFSLRQMDVSLRQKEQFPAVAEADFNRWRDQARRNYRMGAAACFGKIGFDIVFAFLLKHGLHPPFALQVTLGLSAVVAWIALVALAVWRTQRTHALARDLGIEARTRSSSKGEER